MTNLTDEMKALWQRSKLDCRCLDCGAESAATGWCYRCTSKNLEYIPHGAPGWTRCLGSGRSGGDTTAARATRAVLPARSHATP